jgi:hypothetical protein
MNSRTDPSFWNAYWALPERIQRTARKQYYLWLSDPHHPSVRFKKVGEYWSARVNDDYRALAIMDEDTVIWFWIGSHKRYDRLIKN